VVTGKTPSARWDHKGLDKAIDDLVNRFAEHIFVDANLESQAEGVVTYRLQPAAMCGHLSPPPSADGGTTTVPVPDHNEVRFGTLRSIIRQSVQSARCRCTCVAISGASRPCVRPSNNCCVFWQSMAYYKYSLSNPCICWRA